MTDAICEPPDLPTCLARRSSTSLSGRSLAWVTTLGVRTDTQRPVPAQQNRVDLPIARWQTDVAGKARGRELEWAATSVPVVPIECARRIRQKTSAHRCVDLFKTPDVCDGNGRLVSIYPMDGYVFLAQQPPSTTAARFSGCDSATARDPQQSAPSRAPTSDSGRDQDTRRTPRRTSARSLAQPREASIGPCRH